MTNYSWVFPAGVPGVALLLLRVSNALLLLAGSACLEGIGVWTRFGLAVIALLLSLGYFTRVAAGLSAAVAAFGAIGIGGTLGIAVGFHAVTAVAVAMLGGGAYSIDGRLFGRRVIRFDH